jgi:4-diphosphocytidyl-2-C-methyl-D-erythritol kinase
MTRVARLRAYAKVNLGLRVLYKRPDKYHELRTVFQTISLADVLEISFTPAKVTRIEMEGTPEIADNLAERAARLTLDAMGRQGSVRLTLRKNVPAGAGLGGGSSDAAAVLLALPVLVGGSIPIDRLSQLATALGSDVPFFLHGGTALGMGRGEELYPLPDYPATRALLIASGIHSSTADAYRDLSPTLTTDTLQNKLSTFQRGTWEIGKSSIINDFEGVVVARHPELSGIRERLRRAGASRVAMTGSGSAIFGIFDDPGRLERARLTWKKNSPDEQIFAISFISRARYRGAWQRALRQNTKGSDTWPPQSRHVR